MNQNIFISYRRADSHGSAGRIYDRLVAHFGADRIFMDVDAIQPGLDFVNAIETAVNEVNVLLVIIGPTWLTAGDTAGNRRLDNPEDFVRREVATALQRNIRVIPVLIEPASMPRSTDLPEGLQSLARRNAIEISHTRFDLDVQRLINTLELAFKDSKSAAATSKKKTQSQKSKRISRVKLWLFVVFFLLLTCVLFWVGYPIWDKNFGPSSYAVKLSEKYNFYSAGSYPWSKPTSMGFQNQFEDMGDTVYDLATGLTWQKGGEEVTYFEIEGNLRKLNRDKLGGYNDWRLPTLVEGWTLLEHDPIDFYNRTHIDRLFDTTQLLIWTSVIDDKGYGWFISFSGGTPLRMNAWGSEAYLRAVRGNEFK